MLEKWRIINRSGDGKEIADFYSSIWSVQGTYNEAFALEETFPHQIFFPLPISMNQCLQVQVSSYPFHLFIPIKECPSPAPYYLTRHNSPLAVKALRWIFVRIASCTQQALVFSCKRLLNQGVMALGTLEARFMPVAAFISKILGESEFMLVKTKKKHWLLWFQLNKTISCWTSHQLFNNDLKEDNFPVLYSSSFFRFSLWCSQEDCTCTMVCKGISSLLYR